MALTKREKNVIERWENTTPRFPGNSLPGWDNEAHQARMPTTALCSTYEELYGFAPRKSIRDGRDQLITAITALNDAIKGADQRSKR